jgi:hypothetical protein
MKSNFQVRQASRDLSNWQPKASNLTPPDTFNTRKEVVSFGNSYGRKLECDGKIAADEKGDLCDKSVGKGKEDVYCICMSSDGDTKIVTTGYEPAEESLADLTVQQSVMEEHFKMKKEIRKYKELCKKQVTSHSPN